MKRFNKIYFSICIFLIISMSSFADSPEIYSKNFEATKDTIIYWGDVEVITDDYKIFADYLIYYRDKSLVEAEGRVVMTSSDVSVSGDKLTFNLKEMKGEMYEVSGMMEPSVKFRVDKLIQTDRVTQKFENMHFTSCSQLVPRWEIVCKRGKIKKDKYIEMKHAILKIKKIPILYFPYLRYPARNGKVTGFLFPLLGKSDKLGYFMKNSFFWNIKSNYDVTFSMDYIEKVGFGFGADLRYLFKNSSGDIDIYTFKYSEDYKENYTSENALSDYDYNIKAKHIQRMDFLRTSIKADINYQSNPEFQNVFNKNYGRFRLSRFSSSIFINSYISNLKLSVILSRNETFYLQKLSSNVITKLPGINLNLNQQKLGKIPGYFSVSAGYESIERSGVNYEEEINYTTGIKSRRFSLIPSYTLNIFKLPWLSTSVDLKSKNSYYLQSRDPETNDVVDDPLHLQYNSVKINLKGPSFYRIFKGKKNKIKHLIEPEINLSYSTKISEEDRNRLIPVDIFDFPSFSYINFTLNSRIFVKGKGSKKSPREVFTYTLSQKYYFDPFEANRFRQIEVDGEKIYPEFSELTNTLRFRPSEELSLDLSLIYNHYLKEFQRVNMSLSFLNKAGTVNGRFSYSKYINPYQSVSYFLNREMLRGDLKINIPGFPIKIDSGIDYDITEKNFRYGTLILSYDYQCIKFNAEFKVYTSIDGNIYPYYTVGISFGNLGMVKDFFGGM